MGAGQSPTASTPLREGPPSCVGIRKTPALWRVFDFSECTLPGPSWLLGFSRALSPCGCRPPQASLWADLSLPDPGTRPSPPAPGPDPETPLHRLWPGAWCSAWPGVAWPHRAGAEAAGPPCSARASRPEREAAVGMLLPAAHGHHRAAGCGGLCASSLLSVHCGCLEVTRSGAGFRPEAPPTASLPPSRHLFLGLPLPA